MPKFADNKSNVGQNVAYEIKNDKLTITIDLTKELGLSASQKSKNIATTNGNAKLDIGTGLTLGLNLYTPNK